MVHMDENYHDLLSERCLTIDQMDPPVMMTLPELLTRLLTGPDVEDFPNLAAEQHGYWWRFMVRCAAKALHELGMSVEAAVQRNTLAAEIAGALADAAPPGAWDLYQPDPSLPAFLQPPDPEDRPLAEKWSANSPSLLTGALGAKMHERKPELVRELTPEQAVYALVEYQSGAIYGGRGNYPSQLMGSASGAGSGTPFMGASIGGSRVETFRHDVATLLGRWEAIRSGPESNVWALWAESWDGKSRIQSRRLDPAFIPVARRVRLGAPDEDGRFRTVWFRPSEGPRVEDLSGGGNLGDPFTPLVRDPKDESRLKVRGTLGWGYNYTEVVRLLFGEDARPSPSVEALRDADDGSRADLYVVFEGVAYEQGKTGGFHRREVLLPPGIADLFTDPDPVRATHAQMLKRVKDAKSALRGAARIYMTGTPRARDGDAARADLPAGEIEPRVDAVYLDHLFTFADRQAGGDESWLWEWGGVLRDLARNAFRRTLPTLPGSLARRYERETAAWDYLGYKLAELAEPKTVLAAEHPAQEVTT